MRIALSVAGSDPTGGAGLQLDLQVFRALGVHGAGVVTALTIQDTGKVHRVLPAFPSVVMRPAARAARGRDAARDQARHARHRRRAARGGARPRGAAASRAPPLVIDPVLRASDGAQLLERRAYGALVDLMKGAALVTPNLPEAEQLSGLDVSSRRGAEQAARWFVAEAGAEAALVKGGHRDGDADDCLARRAGDGIALAWLPGERIAGAPVHGTGCALSAAIAAGLAQGVALDAAIARGRSFVREAIAKAETVGAGRLLVF